MGSSGKKLDMANRGAEKRFMDTLFHTADHYLLIVKLFRSVFVCVSEFLWKLDKKKMHSDGSQHCLLWVSNPLRGILRSSGTASPDNPEKVTEPSCSDTGLTCLVCSENERFCL